MSNNGQSFVPAGWFDDPAGSGQQRWWNGSEWTEHLHDAVAAARDTAAAQPAYQQQQPSYTQQQPAYGQKAPDAPQRGARVYNAFIWVIALLPALGVLQALTIDYGSIFSSSRLGSTSAQLAMYSNPTYLLSNLLSFLVYVATVVLAYLDWRALLRTGYLRPFHWAWSFLTPGVYVIGRSAVIKRRAGRGLTPIWVWAGLGLVTLVVTVARVIPAVVDSVSTIPSIGA